MWRWRSDLSEGFFYFSTFLTSAFLGLILRTRMRSTLPHINVFHEMTCLFMKYLLHEKLSYLCYFSFCDFQDADREARAVPTQKMAEATAEVEKVQPEQQQKEEEEEEPLVARQQAKNWRHKYEAWVNKSCNFPPCSKSKDHESIPCPELWLLGLRVGLDYLL